MEALGPSSSRLVDLNSKVSVVLFWMVKSPDLYEEAEFFFLCGMVIGVCLWIQASSRASSMVPSVRVLSVVFISWCSDRGSKGRFRFCIFWIISGVSVPMGLWHCSMASESPESSRYINFDLRWGEEFFDFIREGFDPRIVIKI